MHAELLPYVVYIWSENSAINFIRNTQLIMIIIILIHACMIIIL
jgi:hypothetical protein